MTSINVIILQKSTDASYSSTVSGYFIDGGGITYTKTTVDISGGEIETTAIKNSIDTTAGVFNIIIYDWSVCITPSNINAILLEIIALGVSSWNVAYLGKWMDNCTKYSHLADSIANTNIEYVVNSEPLGFNAVLLDHDTSLALYNFIDTNPSYNSINYALQEIGITQPSTTFIATSPNLFTYGPLYNTTDTSKTYAVKTQECSLTNSEINPPSDNNLTFFWILLLVLGTGLIIWFILTSRQEGKEIRAENQMIAKQNQMKSDL